MTGLAVRVEGLCMRYSRAGIDIPVLEAVDVSLAAGERVAIVGPSGSGKSTFLHLLGMLDTPSAGRIWLDDVEIGRLAESGRDRLRNRRVGFVFQSHHLLPEHSALGNVMVPLRLAGCPVPVARDRARAFLDAVGLYHRVDHRPGELSGGEQQRVALARALVMGPGLVLADEPTGNLDPGTARGVFELMLDLNRQLGTTLVVVTHSHELAARFPRRLELQDGRFEEQ